MEWISILQLTSLAAVVTTAIGLTHLAKRLLADVPGASRVPVWVYTSVIAGALTYVAREITGTLQGQTGVLIVDGMINGAMASGVLEWARAATKPLSASSTAREASVEAEIGRRMRGWVLPLLLAGAVASSCGGARPTLPDETATVAAVRSQAVEIAKAVESAGQLVVEARRATGAAYDARLITLEQRNRVYQAVIDLEPKAHAVIDRAATVTTHDSLRGIVSEFAGVLADLLDALGTGNAAMAASASAIRTAVATVTAYLGGAR